MPELKNFVFEDIEKLDEFSAAIAVTNRITQLDGIARTMFFEMAWLARECDRRQLWRYVQSLEGKPFESYNQWLKEKVPYCRSHVYAGVGLLDELEKDIPVQDILFLKESNAKVLAQVSSAVRKQPEIIEAAKTLEGSKLVEKIAQVAPEQHLEQRQKIVFNPTVSQAIVILQWLEHCQSQGESREDAIERIAVEELAEGLE